MLTPTSDVPSEMPPRRTLSARAGYALAAVIVGLAPFASGVPSLLRTQRQDEPPWGAARIGLSC